MRADCKQNCLRHFHVDEYFGAIARCNVLGRQHAKWFKLPTPSGKPVPHSMVHVGWGTLSVRGA